MPQLNPSMSVAHFNQLMDQMFAGFKVGGDMGIMTSTQVMLLPMAVIMLMLMLMLTLMLMLMLMLILTMILMFCTRALRRVCYAYSVLQCLQAVRLLQLPPKPHLSWQQLQVRSQRS